MRAILAMVGKDLRLLARDRMGFFFTFVFPLAVAIFFGTMFAGSDHEPRGLGVALVDEDGSPESRAFAAVLDSVPELDVRHLTRVEAQEAVTLGKRIAYVVLPRGFGDRKRRLFQGPGPEVELGLDPSRKPEGGMIQGVLTRYLSQDLQALFAHPASMRASMRRGVAEVDSARDLPGERRASIHRFLGALDRFLDDRAADTARVAAAGEGWQPVRFRTIDVARKRSGPRNSYDISFPQGVLWAILNGSFGFAMALVNERTRGTLVRLRMAPVARAQILAAKALAALIAILTVATIVLALGAAFFHVRPSSAPLLALAVFSAACALTGIMLVVSASGSTPRAVSGLGWAVLMTMSMTGGAMIPLVVMPAWMQRASMISPVRWAIVALEGALWRGFTPAQMMLPCAILLGLGILGFALGTRILSRTEA
ncbi:MAG: ABC transporter permease [Candidatus Eisenbacteria bacterium]|uniref:ABC transporter permease n=1 Tax=Eiseniibacteriota bacterium TaxID=2212470 RepID=A0A538UBC6_UNCEI|nr:MAG: ABC transporter permease [Candidatus Eisenbacteria bacterium]